MALENISLLEKALPIMIGSLTGTIVGGVIGFLSSNYTLEKNWKRQKQYELQNTAYAMYQDFNLRNELLNKMILMVKKTLNFESDSNFSLIYNSVYSEKELHFSFRKEISAFDTELSNSIIRVYAYLEDADKQRVTAINCSGNTSLIYEPLLNKLEVAQRELQNAQKLFRKNFGFSEDDFVKVENKE